MEWEKREKERLRREKQREARRRRILANSEARMKTLRTMGERSAPDSISENKGDIQGMATAVEETHMPCENIEYADPPDELIVRQPVPSASRNTSNEQLGNSGGASQLSHVVAVLQSNKVFRIRTAVAILCSLVVTILNTKTVHPISYVLCQLAVDGCILSWVFITLPSVSSIPSPLGRLAVAKLALIYLHPSLAAVFETVCLFLCLSGAVLRDLCTMVFFLVLSVSIPSIII